MKKKTFRTKVFRVSDRIWIWKCLFSMSVENRSTERNTSRSRGQFIESPDNFSGPKSCFMFALFTFKIKVSIILKMIQWDYQLTKQNWLVCELGTLLLFNRFWFQNLPSDPKSYRAFRETGPRFPFLEDPGNISAWNKVFKSKYKQ